MDGGHLEPLQPQKVAAFVRRAPNLRDQLVQLELPPDLFQLVVPALAFKEPVNQRVWLAAPRTQWGGRQSPAMQ